MYFSRKLLCLLILFSTLVCYPTSLLCSLQLVGERIRNTKNRSETRQLLEEYARLSQLSKRTHTRLRGELLATLLASVDSRAEADSEAFEEILRFVHTHRRDLRGDKNSWGIVVEKFIRYSYAGSEKDFESNLLHSVLCETAWPETLVMFGLSEPLRRRLFQRMFLQIREFDFESVHQNAFLAESEMRIVLIIAAHHYGLFGESANPGFTRPRSDYSVEYVHALALLIKAILQNQASFDVHGPEIHRIMIGQFSYSQPHTVARMLRHRMERRLYWQLGVSNFVELFLEWQFDEQFLPAPM